MLRLGPAILRRSVKDSSILLLIDSTGCACVKHLCWCPITMGLAETLSVVAQDHFGAMLRIEQTIAMCSHGTMNTIQSPD
jgi:hypothetical protein